MGNLERIKEMARELDELSGDDDVSAYVETLDDDPDDENRYLHIRFVVGGEETEPIIVRKHGS